MNAIDVLIEKAKGMRSQADQHDKNATSQIAEAVKLEFAAVARHADAEQHKTLAMKLRNDAQQLEFAAERLNKDAP